MSASLAELIERNAPSPENLSSIMERPDPQRMYTIFFTPRSGSSWLTDLLTSTLELGLPNEWYSPQSACHITKSLPASNVSEYTSVIKKLYQSDNGVFGSEISFFDMENLGEHVDLEQTLINGSELFYLTRADFVSQAISLYRAVESAVFHFDSECSRMPQKVKYDSDRIIYWIRHIMHQEWAFRRFFEEKGISPFRFTYEELAASPVSIVSLFYKKVTGKILPVDYSSGSSRPVYRTAESAQWKERFENECASFVRECEAYRWA